MDAWIQGLIQEYYTLIYHVLTKGTALFIMVCIFGSIRFGIAVYRRSKGMYPPESTHGHEHN